MAVNFWKCRIWKLWQSLNQDSKIVEMIKIHWIELGF